MSPRSQELSQEMRQRSRSALLKAARQLFARNGFHNCRVADVAREAGMSTGNVYWYFKSKPDLLRAVLLEGLEELGEIFQTAATSKVDAVSKLRKAIRETLDFGREKGDFNTVLLAQLGQSGASSLADLGIDMETFGYRYTQSLVSILEQAQQEGLIPPHENPQLLAMMFFGFFNGLNLTYGQEWLAFPEQEITSGVFRLLHLDLNQGDQLA